MSNFTEACIMANNEWIELLPLEIEKTNHSKHYDKQIKKLFNKMDYDKYHKITLHTTRALIIAAILLLMTITAFALPTSREYIIDKFSIYSTYSLLNKSDVQNVKSLSVSYIPKGYKLSSKSECDDFYSYTYTNESNKELFIDKYITSASIDFDTEKYDSKTISDNNIDYTVYYATNSDEVGIIWNSGNYLYSISANLDEDTLIQVAKSTK